MYLFVDYSEALERVPKALIDGFGEPAEVMTLKLTTDRVLARSNAEDVLREIEERGFYLQMPPPGEPRPEAL